MERRKLLSKKGVFFGKKGCTSKMYGERETSLQKWWFFFGKNGCTSWGMERGKLLSLRSRERRHFFRARFAGLSKVMFFGQKWVHRLDLVKVSSLGGDFNVQSQVIFYFLGKRVKLPGYREDKEVERWRMNRRQLKRKV